MQSASDWQAVVDVEEEVIDRYTLKKLSESIVDKRAKKKKTKKLKKLKDDEPPAKTVGATMLPAFA